MQSAIDTSAGDKPRRPSKRVKGIPCAIRYYRGMIQSNYMGIMVLMYPVKLELSEQHAKLCIHMYTYMCYIGCMRVILMIMCTNFTY